MQGTCTINGVEFTPLPGVRYAHDYVKIVQDIHKMAETRGEEYGVAQLANAYQYLFLNDLFFITYFVVVKPQTEENRLRVNHPFVVQGCQDVEEGPLDMTLDVWAREHFKSTIITIAETLQFFAKEPEEGCGIISATRSLAKDFMSAIMRIMQTEGPFLHHLFPDGGFWVNPEREASKWSLNEGANLNRKSNDPTPSLYAAGLEEGMPTGKHFKRRVYDDIVNADISRSAQRMTDLKMLYDVSQDIGKIGGHHRVVGTFYHYADPLVAIKDKVKINSDESLYHLRIKPATEDGSPNGKPVLLSQEALDVKKTQKTYHTQQLCQPVPESTRKIPGALLREMDGKDIPANILKLQIVDPAGTREDGKGDDWASVVLGVEPNVDDFGASNFYILDLFLDQIPEAEGPRMASEMWLRNGRIAAMGVEKVALASAEQHIANALRVHGVHLSKDFKNLIILKPIGRSKEKRIEDAFAYPLYNGKLFISKDIPVRFRDRLKEEMDTFPYGAHDDGIDAIAYGIRDMMADKIVMALLQSLTPANPDALYDGRGRFKRIATGGGANWLGM